MLGLNKVYNMDCIEGMRLIDDNSIDSIVTDPPYELGFMGKSWDNTGISNNKEMWAECLRILKPGGYLLSFGGTRTYHRMASAIEDAGFEVRDMIEWVYGSGFPKSLNIGKAVDKRGGTTADQSKEFAEYIKNKRNELNITLSKADEVICGGTTNYSWFEGRPAGQRLPRKSDYLKMKELLNLDDRYDSFMEETEREVVGLQKKAMSGWNIDGTTQFKDRDITKGTSEWEGWGTALKPAHEPICMARKPIQGTVAENVLKYGTGGINIDESRVGYTSEYDKKHQDDIQKGQLNADNGKFFGGKGQSVSSGNLQGRFPANLILGADENGVHEEVRECFPDSKAGSYKGEGSKSGGIWSESTGKPAGMEYGDSGNASRFFKSIIYQAKASKSERNKGCEELEEKESGMPLMIQREWEQGERDRITDILSKYIVDTDSDCAEKFGVSSALVRFWKRGERTPTQENLRLLKKVYNFGDSVDDLLNINLIVKTNRETILDKSYRPLAKNNHPTVKPIALMEYLIKMVTPKCGVVLDPFMGSGTTGCASKKNGYNYIGFELDKGYREIANKRIQSIQSQLF